MENRALENSSTSTQSSISKRATECPRNIWVLTAYGISGLALFGILAYYFVEYVTK